MVWASRTLICMGRVFFAQMDVLKHIKSRQNGHNCATLFIFLHDLFLYFDSSSIGICSQGPIDDNDNNLSLVQIMAWCQSDNASSSEKNDCLMHWHTHSTSLGLNGLTPLPLEPHTCVSELGPHLVQIMACRLIGAKPLSEPIPEYC